VSQAQRFVLLVGLYKAGDVDNVALIRGVVYWENSRHCITVLIRLYLVCTLPRPGGSGFLSFQARMLGVLDIYALCWV